MQNILYEFTVYVLSCREDETWVEFINNVVVGYSDNLGKPNNNAFTRSYPTVPYVFFSVLHFIILYSYIKLSGIVISPQIDKTILSENGKKRK